MNDSTREKVMSFAKELERELEREKGLMRLEMLAIHLDGVSDEQFDYDSWVGEGWGGKADFSCGTTACALGHATTIPELRALGLRMTPGGRVPFVENDRGEHLYGVNAAQRLFGITRTEADFLFIPQGGEPTRNAAYVAKKIRNFVAEKRSGLT